MVYDSRSETNKHNMIILLDIEGMAAMQLKKQKEKVKEILEIRIMTGTKLKRTAKPLPLQEVYL